MNVALWIVTGLLAAVLLVSTAKIVVPRERIAAVGGSAAEWVMDFNPAALRAIGVLELAQAEADGRLVSDVVITPRKIQDPKSQALLAVRKELFNAFGDTVSVQTFSGESKQGVDEARAVVAGWLGL